MKATQEYNGKPSGIRIGMYSVLAMSGMLTLSICAYLLVGVYKGREIDFTGMTAMIGSIGWLVGVGMGAKAYQKGKEKNNEVYLPNDNRGADGLQHSDMHRAQ